MPHDLLGWLQIADALALACVAVRLSFGGLFRAYPALYAHAIFESVSYLVTLFVPFSQYSYGVYYVSVLPIRWLLWVAVVDSLYRQTLKRHPGLLTMGRRVLMGGLITTFLFVALTLRWDLPGLTRTSWMLTVALTADRTLTLALALLVLSLCAFLAWFLIPARRNIAYLCLAFGIVFAADSSAMLIRNAGGLGVNYLINVARTIVTSAVFFITAATLKPAGEEQIAFVGRNPSERQVEEAVGRLRKVTRHLGG